MDVDESRGSASSRSLEVGKPISRDEEKGVFPTWPSKKVSYDATQSANADDMIFKESIFKELRRNCFVFFKCQALYKFLALPWNRGLLLLGPPGSGKTGSIKVLANMCAEIDIPTLYLQMVKIRAGHGYGLSTKI